MWLVVLVRRGSMWFGCRTSELTVRFRVYLMYINLALEIISRNEATLARVATVRTIVTVGRYLA